MKTARPLMFSMVILAAMMVAAVSSFAQDRPADNMRLIVEKIRADKKLLVGENMQLTETEANAFWPVYDQYQNELFLLRVRTANLIKDYSDAIPQITNEIARKLLDEYMVIESLGITLRQIYLLEFRKVLPDAKVARYYQIENKIQAALMYELAQNIPLLKDPK